MAMMENALKRGLRAIMSNERNLGLLLGRFENLKSMTGSEVLDWAVGELYSDGLLAELDRRLVYVPACSMSYENYDTGALCAEYEARNSDGAIGMPKVWPKRMVRVGGWGQHETGTFGVFHMAKGPVCYMDEDGVALCVTEWRNSIGFAELSVEEWPEVVYRTIARDGDEKLFALDYVENLLPAGFKGLWSPDGGEDEA